MPTNKLEWTHLIVPEMEMSWVERIQKLTGVITEIKEEQGMLIGIVLSQDGNYLFPFVDSQNNPLPILSSKAVVGDVVEFCVERRMDRLDRTDFSNKLEIVAMHASFKLAW